MLPALLLSLLLARASAEPSAWACGAARRRGLRRSQEDFTLLASVPGGAGCAALQLAAVFDGHEGAAAAAFAARALPEAVSAALADDASACDAAAASWRGDALAEALRRALAAVDDAFVAVASSTSPPLRDGSTAVAVLLPAGGAGVALAHVGDSRALLCAAGGAPAVELAAPHSPDAPAERARIAAAGGTVARGRLEGELAVSRALGDLPYRSKGLVSSADAAWHALPSADVALLLASDGALERATAAQLCAVAAGDAAARRSLAAEGAGRRRAAVALGPTPGAASRLAPPGAASLGADGGGPDDDDASGPLAAAAAAAADAAIAAGSADNVAVIRCALGIGGDGNGASDGVVSSAEGAAPGSLLAGRWLLVAPAAVLRGPVRELGRAPPAARGVSLAPWAEASRECAALPAEWTRDGEHALPGRGFALALDGGGAHAACVKALLALPGPDDADYDGDSIGEDAASPDEPEPPEPPPLGGGRFRLGAAAGSGHFGEVWHARSARDGDAAAYVLKRSWAGPALAAAAREAHFGAALRGAAGAARLVDAFTAADGARWLAFVDEGTSLAALMYGDGGGATPQRHRRASAGGVVLLQPSAWWRERRASAAGAEELRGLLAGVLSALAEVHGRGVAHRDVKPGNVLLSAAGGVRLCDWGSAVSAAALQAGLYGAEGPSAAEETREYAPPEAHAGLGGAAWAGRGGTAGADVAAQMEALFAYDIWSAAVLGLELLALATPDVFAPPPRAAAAAARAAAAAGLGSAARDALTHLRGLAALCVAPPHAGDAAAVALLRGDADCSDAGVAAALRARDPAAADGAAPMPAMALKLLRRMLAWQPQERPSAGRCLSHAFFAAPRQGRGFACAGGHPDAEWADECPDGPADEA